MVNTYSKSAMRNVMLSQWIWMDSKVITLRKEYEIHFNSYVWNFSNCVFSLFL